MRTTVVIKDEFAREIKKLAGNRSLSEFLNRCIEEHLEAKRRKEQAEQLAKAYMRANEDVSKDITADFDDIDREDWPEW